MYRRQFGITREKFKAKHLLKLETYLKTKPEIPFSKEAVKASNR